MLTFAVLSGGRAGSANAGGLQHFLIQLPHDPRFAGLLLRARSDAESPFGALHLGFGRLVVEAAPYVANACWRFARRMCLLRKCGPSGRGARGAKVLPRPERLGVAGLVGACARSGLLLASDGMMRCSWLWSPIVRQAPCRRATILASSHASPVQFSHRAIPGRNDNKSCVVLINLPIMVAMHALPCSPLATVIWRAASWQ